MKHLFFLIALALFSQSALGHLTTSLRIEHRVNPVGLDDLKPRLQWQLKGDEKGLRQSAYEVIVSSDLEKLQTDHGDLWHSSKTKGNDLAVAYDGQPLPTSSRIYWKVRTWNQKDQPSDWSPPQNFTTGLIGQKFDAPWISFRDQSKLHDQQKKLHLPPARYYRKVFTPSKKVTSAIAYASALGIYDLHANGSQVGDAYFSPGWTNYIKRAYYNTYDLTSAFQQEKVALGAKVADGWYAGYVGYGKLVGYGPSKSGRNIYGKTPAFALQIHLTYEDGTSEIVTTDPSWKVTTGPELEADFLMGEIYDARKELTNWDTSNYDDSAWDPAILAEENGSTKALFIDKFIEETREFGFQKPPIMQAYPAQLVKITEEIKPISLTEHKPGVFIFDLGQNIAGNVRLTIKGESGQRIKLRFGEMLHPDGRLMTENLRRARATDTYICKGDPEGETWTPRFTFHGFQFVELTGVKELPTTDTLTGLVIHSDTPLTSSFECSDKVVNKIFQNAIWTQRGNWIELPTDCPQRDERLGWTGDAQIYAAASAYHADVGAFFKKWLRELEDSRTEDGLYPSYAPYPFGHGRAAHGTAWGDAGVIVPHSIWKATGDQQFFQNHWEAMTGYMDRRKELDPDLKGTKFGASWGDWLNLNDPTPHEYIDLCYFTLISRQMTEMAQAHQKTSEVAKYQDWIKTLRKNFQENYLQEDGTIEPSSQSAYVLAIDCGMFTDQADITKAAALLAGLMTQQKTETTTGMTTGFLGTKPLLPILTATGYHDEAIEMIQSRKYPSWGYEVKNGATTIWERWDSFTKENGFKRGMNSFSHYAFGAVTQWMIESLAGIAPAEPGFTQIQLHPKFPSTSAYAANPDTISWVKSYYDSAQGRISVSWKKEDNGNLSYHVVVPPNSTGILTLPTSSPFKSDDYESKTTTIQAGSYRYTIN